MDSLYESATPNSGGTRDIEPARVAEAGAKVRIIDVRQPHEYTGELGHVPGAELVPLEAVPPLAQDWDRDEEIVLVCRSGARSGRMATALASMGFTRVMNMVGGMIAWNAAGLAVER